ncbi:hypothetical protein BN940_17046 [Castellaniella defragrans 65Phen]|uniref:Uncharacterized protein n=1 Tax=Castellaniella defragrans (strain DSM 12143 / CCUG 39792 / 65Phen) TaxID=1437824 RepID=W8X5Q9_CASD6|nr:hypothetical protein BN940_17046 [Castellaniella defragrans 65Phen]
MQRTQCHGGTPVRRKCEWVLGRRIVSTQPRRVLIIRTILRVSRGEPGLLQVRGRR